LRFCREICSSLAFLVRLLAIIACEPPRAIYNESVNMFAPPARRFIAAAGKRQIASEHSMGQWLRNIWDAVYTVAYGMWVTMRYWLITYRPDRKTFTEHFEYPELPVPVAARYRGFHRFDLTTCIGCDQCAKACPVDCIYIGKEKTTGKGFRITGFAIDYSKCMFCALCVEPCPVDCIFMGASHDLSCYSRDGCIVDFARLPVEVAWGRATLNPTAVAASKVVAEPVHGGPNQ
jgi:NADH-quinone oxidoreductase subunit I